MLQVAEMVEEIEAEAARLREQTGRPALGAQAIIAQDPHARPFGPRNRQSPAFMRPARGSPGAPPGLPAVRVGVSGGGGETERWRSGSPIPDRLFSTPPFRSLEGDGRRRLPLRIAWPAVAPHGLAELWPVTEDSSSGSPLSEVGGGRLPVGGEALGGKALPTMRRPFGGTT